MLILCAAACVLLIAGAVILIIALRGDSPASVSGTEPADATASEATASEPDEALLHGEPVAAELLVGSWVSYTDGMKLIYSYDDDGCAVFRSDNGAVSEYHYEIQGDRVIMTGGEKRKVYIWTPLAETFISDHPYGETAHLTSLIREQVEDFSGYLYVQGDYLYSGKLCMCREDQLDGYDDSSLVGSWTGAAADRVTFTADGGYHYREMSYDYDGTYRYDAEADKLTLILDGEGTVLSDADWDLNGRVLRIQKRYYFRDNDSGDQ